jgi:hypothetical protein
MPEVKLDGFSYKKAKGLECPFCVSTNMAGLGLAERDDAEDGEMYLVVECHDCGELHHRKYEVAGWKSEPLMDPKDEDPFADDEPPPGTPTIAMQLKDGELHAEAGEPHGMQEWRVKFCQCPTNFNPTQIKYVRAATKEDAKKLINDYVERNLGWGWFNIQDVSPAEAELPEGQVL